MKFMYQNRELDIHMRPFSLFIHPFEWRWTRETTDIYIEIGVAFVSVVIPRRLHD